MTESEIEAARLDIDIDAAKCRRYHDYIRSYWHSLDYWTKVLSVFSGTATFVSALQGWELATKILAFFLALLTSADVVLGFADQGKKHDDLYKRFSDLGVEIELCATPSEADIRRWRAERIKIEGGEPPARDWLERRSAREEAISRGLPINDAWKIGRFKTFMARQLWFPCW
jgi:hypothetical protein